MTITWGECGHPLRSPRHRPAVLSWQSHCRVCELLALPRTWCVDSESRRGNLREYEWVPAWRGREDEANAWRHPLTTEEDIAAQERNSRRALGVYGAWAAPGEMTSLLSIGHTVPPILRDVYDPVTGEPPRGRHLRAPLTQELIDLAAETEPSGYGLLHCGCDSMEGCLCWTR